MGDRRRVLGRVRFVAVRAPHVLLATLGALAACAPQSRRLAYPDGQTYEECEWRGALRDGVRRNYYPDGQLERELAYVRGKAEGPARFFNPAGVLLRSGAYHEGLREGPWTARHDNDHPSAEGSFVHGEKDGAWRFWDENGVEQSSERWSRGVLVGRGIAP